MRIDRSLKSATFLQRLNRFAIAVHLEGERAPVHLPNSGRLHELLTPGRPTLVAPASAGKRRTVGDAAFMLGPNGWVSVDARLPGRLLAEAVTEGALDELASYRVVRLEPPAPDERDTRLDLLLERPGGRALVETKSVTLVEGGTALFPDAPTGRGRRHLVRLAAARGAGYEAYVVFVVQRLDAHRFAPHRRADPDFARALVEAAAAGVRVLAVACEVEPPEIRIVRRLPVALEG
ncbi:DNA/RNA nuclease SfsA [Geochorda subterranea]|uniref:Sugar fermentation stimulation protein homolog n=1 Tax=Geochorda subterranea TaxID=3109564 RepID=A0ABZ1BSL5_9FIRM|nr:DNA/RNA nuclease SfsA [Limnochorda sp. LNt]WRP15455.1 DNA/RNA nuclease SfsA [Limnochorda sp. LNt]